MTGLRPRAERLPFLRPVTEGPLLSLTGVPANRAKWGPDRRLPYARVVAASLGYPVRLLAADAIGPDTSCSVDAVVAGVRDNRVEAVYALRPLHPDEKAYLGEHHRLLYAAAHGVMDAWRRYQRPRLYEDRFFSAAAGAGVLAVMRYDETAGVRFSSYLYQAVYRTLTHELTYLRRWRESVRDARSFQFLAAGWGDPATDPEVLARLDGETEQPIERVVRCLVPELTPASSTSSSATPA